MRDDSPNIDDVDLDHLEMELAIYGAQPPNPTRQPPMLDHAPTPEPILLTTRQAAALLGISEKTLWNHTTPRGNCIPAVRFGKTLRYSRVALEEWVRSQVAGCETSTAEPQ